MKGWIHSIFFVCMVYSVPFFTQPVYGQTQEHSTGVHHFEIAPSCNIKKGIEPNIFYFDMLYGYTCRFAQLTTGIQGTSANADWLLKVMGTPLNTRRHILGLGVTYHLSSLYHVGSIHDLLAALEYTFTIPDTFMFFVQTGYMHQWMRIPVRGFSPIVISQPSMTAAFHLTGIIKHEWSIGFGMSSYELFRYPVFANPSLNFDFYYRSKGRHIQKGLYTGIATALRYSDLFTLSGYPENFVIKSIIGVEF